MKSLQESLLDDEEDLVNDTDIVKLIKNDKDFPSHMDVHYNKILNHFTYTWKNKKVFGMLNKLGLDKFKEVTYLEIEAFNCSLRKANWHIALKAVYEPSVAYYEAKNILISKNGYSQNEAINKAYQALTALKNNPRLMRNLANQKNMYIEDLIK